MTEHQQHSGQKKWTVGRVLLWGLLLVGIGLGAYAAVYLLLTTFSRG